MFRRRTCAILRELKFLMKYVYATSWVPRIAKMAVESPVHARYLHLTGHTTLNSHFHYPRHPWRSVNIFHQELWAPWGWRMYDAETCRSGINILNILFTSRMHFVGFNSLYSWPSACQESIWDTQVVAPSILNLKTRQGGGQLQCSVKFTIGESTSGAT
jgi:hypothetical protein